ncbi:hypothetical protein GT037_007262 [Alternaria burnsii]|uniref:Uncharacterized protein n=1 Tax=Alternaria burnsii TaxID=1187904 RepID=A0A8H7EG15_9PLEO|nr:uncharacterized protein GT037_007262 [Alternaria burnsii]KAF7674502.1 hypothetical protein GT037_007262 [Alternaria burnsii]
MDAPKPLKTAARCLEGRDKQDSFVAIADIMLLFGLSFSCYEKRVDSYGAVDSDTHDKTPKDNFGTCLDAASVKAYDYYDKPDDTAIYYTVTLFHAYQPTYCEQPQGSRLVG